MYVSCSLMDINALSSPTHSRELSKNIGICRRYHIYLWYKCV